MMDYFSVPSIKGHDRRRLGSSGGKIIVNRVAMSIRWRYTQSVHMSDRILGQAIHDVQNPVSRNSARIKALFFGRNGPFLAGCRM